MTPRASFAKAFVEWNLYFLPSDCSAWLWGHKENGKSPSLLCLPAAFYKLPSRGSRCAHFPSPAQSCRRVTANLSPEDLFRFRQLSEHRLRTRFNPKLSYLQSGGQGNPDSGVRPQGEGKWSFDPTVCFPFLSNSIPLPSQTTRQTASRPWVLLVYLYKMSLVLCECLTVVAPRRGSSSQ